MNDPTRTALDQVHAITHAEQALVILRRELARLEAEIPEREWMGYELFRDLIRADHDPSQQGVR